MIWRGLQVKALRKTSSLLALVPQQGAASTSGDVQRTFSRPAKRVRQNFTQQLMLERRLAFPLCSSADESTLSVQNKRLDVKVQSIVDSVTEGPHAARQIKLQPLRSLLPTAQTK